MRKAVNLIVACDKKFGIAKNGVIPWFIKTDLDYFKKITTASEEQKMNAVILGKNSWKTIPDKHRGLDNRFNVVVSTTMTPEELQKDNITKTPSVLMRSFNEAMHFCNNHEAIDKIFICGGPSIYQKAIKKKLINTSYVTMIHDDYNCTSHFPMEELNKFKNMCHADETINSFEISTKTTNETFKMDIHETVFNYNEDETQYLNLLNQILTEDPIGRSTRNSVTHSIFGSQLSFDLTKGFPLLTTKKMFTRGIIEELLFFMKGQTDATLLSNKGVKIWDGNTSQDFLNQRGFDNYSVGDMGPMYGWQFRHFGAKYTDCNADYTNQGFDQLKNVLDLLYNDPTSRRILLTTYDPSKVQESVLAPCHGISIQFYVKDGYLSCKMYQRSVDFFLGLPFNISSYGFLVHMLCHVTGYKPGQLIMTLGDTHIYQDHLDQCKEQISRIPYKFPTLEIQKPFLIENKSIDNAIEFLEILEPTDFKITGYNHHPSIKAKMIA